MDSTLINNKIKQIITLVLFVLCTYYLFKIGTYVYKSTTFPYPIEYREGVSLNTTDHILNNKNPFSLKYHPQNINLYGIGYSVVVAPILKIFKWDTLYTHRAINVLFYFLSSTFLLYLISKLKAPLWLGVSVTLIFLLSVLNRGLGARPDGFGLFLFLLTIGIPYLKNYSTRSLIIAVLLGILSFYIKMYFFLGLIISISYVFLFISKSKGLLYLAIGAPCFLISAFLMNVFFGTYFYNIFFFNIFEKLDIRWSLMQLEIFFTWHSLGLIILLFFAIVLFVRSKSKVVFKFDSIRNFKAPIFTSSLSIFTWALLITFFSFLFLLGANDGAFMSYIFQLITPFLLLQIVLLHRDNLSINLAYFILLAFSILRSYSDLPKLKGNLTMKNWETIETLSKGSLVLNSPLTTPILIKNSNYLTDNGHTWIIPYFKGGKLSNSIFGKDKTLIKINQNYIDTINSNIKAKKYKYAMLTHLDYKWIDSLYLSEHYRLKDTLNLKMPLWQQDWILNIWEPKV